ncbi:MAG: DUF1624 domain-containing protein [Oscillospiraceae bacterium]|jgi:uncharacterized membrane protein|nr:DUF1624 domain-containing protein [Oscillospiraceae bacterium]
MQTKLNQNRIHLLDILRGYAILAMFFVHVSFDLAYLFPTPFTVDFDKIQPFAYFSAVPFILLSGLCSRLTRSNLLRGAKLLLIAFCFTMVTVFVLPDEPIYSGILHMLALSMLVSGVLDAEADALEKAKNPHIKKVWETLKKAPHWLWAAICLMTFAFMLNIPHGYLGFNGLLRIDLPKQLYQKGFLYLYGFASSNFASADYWPVFPWMFLFLFGRFIGGYAKDGRFPKWTKANFCPPLALLGRHSLLIYVLHQPVIYAVLWVVFLIRN